MPSSERSNDLTIHEAARKALQELTQPTHVRDLRRHIEERDYFSFGAEDPERVLGVQLDRHSRGVHISHAASPQIFYRARPATYGLLEWLSKSDLEDLESHSSRLRSRSNTVSWTPACSSRQSCINGCTRTFGTMVWQRWGTGIWRNLMRRSRAARLASTGQVSWARSTCCFGQPAAICLSSS